LKEGIFEQVIGRYVMKRKAALVSKNFPVHKYVCDVHSYCKSGLILNIKEHKYYRNHIEQKEQMLPV